MKCVPEIANWKSFFRSALKILKLFLFSKSKSTTISIVSVNGTLVNKLQTSKETKNVLLGLNFLISSQKLNESLVQCVVEITGLRREERNLARL